MCPSVFSNYKNRTLVNLCIYLLAVNASRKRKFPSVGNMSVSDKAKGSLGSLTSEVPLYHHWLALKMYDIYHDAQRALSSGGDGDIKLSIDSNLVYAIKRSRLEAAVEAIGDACILAETTQPQSCRAMIGDDEQAMTSLKARALDRLVFSDSEVQEGAFLHQAPSRKRKRPHCTSEVSDIALMKFFSFRAHNRGAWDDKRINLPYAMRETSLYTMNSIAINNDGEEWPITFGIPSTCSEACVILYMPIHRKLLSLPIAKAAPNDRALLCVVYVLAHYILAHEPEVFFPDDEQSSFPIPFKDNCGDFSFVNAENMNLFRNKRTGQIHKLIDRDNFPIPDEVMRTINGCDNPNALDGLPPLHCRSLSKDQRYFEIVYKFIDGDHEPNCLKQFVGVVNTLDSLHAQGFVHGDIRVGNIVFHDSSTLIDFDLCRRENDTYHRDYRFYEDERHKHAKKGNKMKKMHDRYALSLIMLKYLNDVPSDIISDLRDESVPLSSVCAKIDPVPVPT